jgi:hypothetical protein
MMARAFLTFGRLLALLAVGGITYAGYAMHPFSPGMYLGLFVVWVLVFGRLF